MGKLNYHYKCDYLILGAGSSGCTLAERLSSNHHNSVIVVEAGQNVRYDPYINNAGNAQFIETQKFVEYFWQGSTIADPSAPTQTSPEGQTFQWTAGRVVGGSSSVNGVLYMRGSQQLYDELWVPQAGNEWSFRKVYDAYKKMENFYGPTTHPEAHGYKGLMSIRAGVPDSQATQDFINSTLLLPGAQLIDDYNYPGTQFGVFPNWQYFEFPDSSRASSLRTYLNQEVMDDCGNGKHGRKLKLLDKTFVSKLLWSTKELRVKGAVAIMQGIPIYIKAKVVISCLGMNSPQFLQVNGIGPRRVLEKANVKVLVDSPWVGQNLTCYPYTTISMVCPPGVKNNTDPGTLNVAGALFPNPLPGSDPNFLQFKFQPLIYPAGELNLLIITIEAPLLPKSRGSIEIQSGDPTKVPVVQLGLLSDPWDVATIAACIKYVVPVIENLQNKLGYTLLAPTMAQINDPAQLEAYIRSTVGNTYHYQSSNRMGKDISTGVVDQWGKVHGVKGLMVVDNSIAATGTNGNPDGTARMMGFRIGEHLLGEC